MSRLVDEILQAAGAEHEARAPAEVINLPVRSKFLDKTAVAPPGREVPTWLARVIQAGPYLSVAMFVVTAMFLWSGWRQTQMLSEIGAATCSGIGSYKWVEENLVAACAKAYRVF